MKSELVIENEVKTVRDFFEKEVSFINSGKLLRSQIALLLIKSFGCSVNNDIYDVILAGELIHTASLLHDDVIDEGDERRNEPTIRKTFGNKNSIILGNQVLTKAIDKIIKLNSIKILDVYNSAIGDMCRGEILQIEQTGEIPTLDDYILKSKFKTASLFSAILKACKILCGNDLNIDVEKFGEDFGIAFQIKNDLDDILTAKTDIDNGIYTAPVIYSKGLKLSEDAIEKTFVLIDNYISKVLNLIKDVRDSEYKSALIEVIECLRK